MENKDEYIRKEFAKAFNWRKTSYYNNEADYSTPTWEQIFVKIGELLKGQKIEQE
jgi:DNA-binding XRE family transcriptional regulator